MLQERARRGHAPKDGLQDAADCQCQVQERHAQQSEISRVGGDIISSANITPEDLNVLEEIPHVLHVPATWPYGKAQHIQPSRRVNKGRGYVAEGLQFTGKQYALHIWHGMLVQKSLVCMAGKTTPAMPPPIIMLWKRS
jgi:hypothetical protein